MQQRIDLDRHDTTGRASQRLRQHAPSRADFQHGIVRCEVRRRDDFSDDVRIDEKILTESFVGRREGGAGHQSASAGRALAGLGQRLGQGREGTLEAIGQVGEFLDQIVREH